MLGSQGSKVECLGDFPFLPFLDDFPLSLLFYFIFYFPFSISLFLIFHFLIPIIPIFDFLNSQRDPISATHFDEV